MQALESLLSFLVLVSLSSFLLIGADSKVDNSLYLYQLQGDAKNIIHLKGGFENISAGNEVAMAIYDATGLCIQLSQTDLTSYNVEGGVSSTIPIPQLKTLVLQTNGSVMEMKNSNLTGFVPNQFSYGACQ